VLGGGGEVVVRRDKTRREGEETKFILKDEDEGEDEGEDEDDVDVPVHRLWGCLRCCLDRSRSSL
jgi:hypothetical protein